MFKRPTHSFLITALILVSFHIGTVHSEEAKILSCEENAKHQEQLLVEQKDQIIQLNSELEEERALRKELQEQLDALTELEEDINERETLDNNLH